MQITFLYLLAILFSSPLVAFGNSKVSKKKEDLTYAKYVYIISLGGKTGGMHKSCVQVAFKLKGYKGLFTALHGFYEMNQPGNNFKNYSVDQIIDFKGDILYSNTEIPLHVSKVCLESDMAYIPISDLDKVDNFPKKEEGLVLKSNTDSGFLGTPLIVPVFRKCGISKFDIHPEAMNAGITAKFQEILDNDTAFGNAYRNIGIPSSDQDILYFDNYSIKAGTSGAPVFLNKYENIIVCIIQGLSLQNNGTKIPSIKSTAWGIFFNTDCFREYQEVKDSLNLIAAYKASGLLGQEQLPFRSEMTLDTPLIRTKGNRKTIIETDEWSQIIKKDYRKINGRPSFEKFKKFPFLFKYYNKIDGYTFGPLKDDSEIGILYSWLFAGGVNQKFENEFGEEISDWYPVTKWMVKSYYDYSNYKKVWKTDKKGKRKKELLMDIDTLSQFIDISENELKLWQKAGLNLDLELKDFIHKAEVTMYFNHEQEIIQAYPSELSDSKKGHIKIDSVNSKELEGIDLADILDNMINDEYQSREKLYDLPNVEFNSDFRTDSLTITYRIDVLPKNIYARTFYCNYPPGKCEFSGSQLAINALGKAMYQFYQAYGCYIDTNLSQIVFKGFADSLRYKGSIHCLVQVKKEDKEACDCGTPTDCDNIEKLKIGASDQKNEALAYLRAYAAKVFIEQEMPFLANKESLCESVNHRNAGGMYRGVEIDFILKLKKPSCK